MSCSSNCSCSRCTRGRKGATGATGAAGVTGATGGGGSGGGGIIPFSGVIPIANEIVDYYLANPGGIVLVTDLSTAPLNFPVPSDRTFSSLAVHVDNLDSFEPGTEITFVVLRDGVPTGLTLVFTDASPLTQEIEVDVPFLAGQLYDLRMFMVGDFDTDTPVAASIGLG